LLWREELELAVLENQATRSETLKMSRKAPFRILWCLTGALALIAVFTRHIYIIQTRRSLLTSRLRMVVIDFVPGTLAHRFTAENALGRLAHPFALFPFLALDLRRSGMIPLCQFHSEFISADGCPILRCVKGGAFLGSSNAKGTRAPLWTASSAFHHV
jgi:hypothetical protein